VTNSLAVGVGMGVGANNLLGVDLGRYLYCLNFALALASNTLVYKVIYRTDVYNIYIRKTVYLILVLDLSKT
jgi:hypothetical protein